MSSEPPSSSQAGDKPYIGGQAVIEGVMMRCPAGVSVAVRRPDGTIAVREGPLQSRLARSRWWRLPALRGVATLVESLALGFRALQFSAEQQLEEEEQAEASGKGAILLSVLIALGLFIALPQGLAAGTGSLLGWELGVQDWRFHLLTGGFKLGVFTAYLALISRMPEIRRVFQYHGAEHKTIFAYEQGLPMTVANVQAQSTLHPRCGTTFLVMVIAVSIVAGSVATPLLLPRAEGVLGQLLTLGLRIGLLPLIAAVSYEMQRLSARYCTRGPLRVLLWPGFAFQKITTREPDDAQVEIAIAAMQAAEWRQRVGESVPGGDDPLVFGSFGAFVEAASALRPAEPASAA